MAKKNKNTPHSTRRFHLSACAYALLILCLTVHMLYDLFLLYCVRKEIINSAALAFEASAFLESQILSLLATTIGTLLLDLEFKRQNRNA